jgi:peroxiredoxin Q/BCP
MLYFYPKEQTSGCTLAAHNFQRDLPKYDGLNAVILGVSFDTVERATRLSAQMIHLPSSF